MAKQLKVLQFMLYSPFGNNKGFSLIEILIVIAIISLTLTNLLGLTSFSLKITSLIRQNQLANNLAQETMEEVRNFRDGTSWDINGLGTLTTSTDYYPQKYDTPFKWQLVPGVETINGFVRKVVFEDVRRDGNDDIIIVGGNQDSNTKKITVTVSWEERGKNHQIALTTYLTNWRQ